MTRHGSGPTGWMDKRDRWGGSHWFYRNQAEEKSRAEQRIHSHRIPFLCPLLSSTMAVVRCEASQQVKKLWELRSVDLWLQVRCAVRILELSWRSSFSQSPCDCRSASWWFLQQLSLGHFGGGMLVDGRKRTELREEIAWLRAHPPTATPATSSDNEELRIIRAALHSTQDLVRLKDSEIKCLHSRLVLAQNLVNKTQTAWK